eukprot:2111319-Prymnesium_polylepis.1
MLAVARVARDRDAVLARLVLLRALLLVEGAQLLKDGVDQRRVHQVGLGRHLARVDGVGERERGGHVVLGDLGLGDKAAQQLAGGRVVRRADALVQRTHPHAQLGAAR